MIMDATARICSRNRRGAGFSHPPDNFGIQIVDARDAQATSPIRTYFIGSGRIGIPVLETLIKTPSVDLRGIATQPDRPAGRRRAPAPTPIAGCAAAHGFAAAKPGSVNDPEFLESLASSSPEIIVVFSFGQLLKEALLTLPPYGCLNIHTSLLPRHRGAAPIAAALLAGDRETGVCFMRMERGLDTGPVYECARTPLNGTETAGILTERLGLLAETHICGVLERVCRDGAQPTPQSEQGATYARQLRKADARMDWRKPAERLERETRAFNPWPCSWFLLPAKKRQNRVQVLEAAALPAPAATPTSPPMPGQILGADSDGLRIACGEGTLRIDALVPEGRNRMTAGEFLRGHTIDPGTILPSPDNTEESGPRSR